MNKVIIIIIAILFSFSAIGQDLITGTTWKSSKPLFENIQSYYEFSPQKEKPDITERWGYSVVFNEDNTFYTSYSAPCGNDCFSRVNGTYKIIHEHYLEVYVTSIKRNGFCSKKDEQPEKVIGTYLFQIKNGSLILKHK